MTKKDFRVTIDPDEGPFVPEPTMGCLLAAGACTLVPPPAEIKAWRRMNFNRDTTQPA